MTQKFVTLVVGVCCIMAAGSVSADVLYDGSSNVTPNQAPWLWGYQALNASPPFTTQVTQAAAGGVTTLNSTAAIGDLAGYTTHIPNLFSPGMAYVQPNLHTLDRIAGFTIDFTVKLNSESHNNANRAGFSVIALSNDAVPQGIELGFWPNQVWAQNAGFTHGESSAALDTTSGLIDYRLQIQGIGYSLLANNVPILSGLLRNYTSFNGGPPLNTGFPYNQQNFMFFGDDTSSALASISLARIALVPEPSTVALLLAGLATCAAAAARTSTRRGTSASHSAV